MKLEVGKTYKTIYGHIAEIICNNAKYKYPVIAIIKFEDYDGDIFEDIFLYDENGISNKYPQYNLVEEYNMWNSVKVDTPILVTDDKYSSKWKRRYFAKYENNTVYAFEGGATNWSADNGDDNTVSWKYSKLAK